MIAKNIRFLLWNQGFWRSLSNTYTIFLTPCIRCTNHVCDSFGLIDVNPHFIPSLLLMIQNVDLLWHHRYKSWSPAIVMSQWPIVPAWFLWTLFFSTMMLRAVIQRVCKRHVCAKFFRICGAVKYLASDVMINWPRAMRMTRNNGFDHNEAGGYPENCKHHDQTGQGQHTARITALIILPRWLL